MNDGSLLALLFSQLTWPSLLVRERACVSIARLLADPGQAGPARDHLLLWLRAQDLESVAALGLLALLRAQIEGVVEPVPIDEVVAAVERPSIQSHLLLGEYAPGRVAFDLSAAHSGAAPAGFAPEPFFGDHVRSYLPPIYDFWAGEIEKRGRIPFRRQWAYEWGLARGRVGTELSVKPLDFWLSGSPYKERYQGADMPLSEVYRSAYLRTLGWAVDVGGLSRDDAVFFAAQACPIDLELWRLEPGRKPPWWPRVEEPEGKIDTTAVAIWEAVEGLWRACSAGEPPWGGDWALAEASGRVHTGTTTYDLEIFGCYQKCHGPAAPDLADLADWYRGEGHRENRVDLLCPSPIRLRGHARGVRLDDLVRRSGDWTLVPAAGPVSVMSSVPRWQWWRMAREVWMPTPCLEGSRAELGFEDGSMAMLGFEDGSMATRIDGQVAARWSDWTEALGETLPEGLPPATGQFLLADRGLIQEFAAATGSSFCWVCRLTGYHQERFGDTLDRFTDHRSFGAPGIVLPGQG